jgi:Predicted membrane protein (DUF2306)
MPAAEKWALGALNALGVGVAAYAVLAYTLLPPGALVHPAMHSVYLSHPVILYGHVFGAALALALGPLQFCAGLRAFRPALHRWIGRALLLSVTVGGVCGLALAPVAQGGLIGRLGFACLAVGWLYTGFRGWCAIRARQVRQHQRWMLRNHALALAAVSLRVYLALALAAGWPFDAAYAAIAWLCWVPNLVLAEWWVRRSAFHAARGV